MPTCCTKTNADMLHCAGAGLQPQFYQLINVLLELDQLWDTEPAPRRAALDRLADKLWFIGEAILAHDTHIYGMHIPIRPMSFRV
jgi:hypothetical protein